MTPEIQEEIEDMGWYVIDCLCSGASADYVQPTKDEFDDIEYRIDADGSMTFWAVSSPTDESETRRRFSIKVKLEI